MRKRESARCRALRSQPSRLARRTRLCHPRADSDPPRSVIRPRKTSHPSLKKQRGHPRKNLLKTISGLPSSDELLQGIDPRQRSLQPLAQRPSARGRKERLSCANSRSRQKKPRLGKLR